MAHQYVLFNPLADNGRGQAYVKDAVEALGGAAECFDVTVTDVRSLIAASDPADTVVLVGGDGTLNYFVNDVYDLPLPQVYLMRSGTGNDFLNDIEPPEGQKLVPINDYLTDLPVVEINGVSRRYLNNVAFGIDGAVCEVADRKKAKGKKKINYTAIALGLLMFTYRPPNATVTVDGETRTYHRVWMAPAMNGRYYGGGMMVAPMQDRNERRLASVVVHHTGRLRTLLRFPGIFTGKHVAHRDMVDWRYGNEITVTFDRPTAVQIDGETVTGVTTFTARRSDATVSPAAAVLKK